MSKVCSHARIDGRDWQVATVGVKIHQGRASDKGRDVCQMVAGIEANPAYAMPDRLMDVGQVQIPELN